MPGVLLLVDFAKAVDTIEWSFIEIAFEVYGCGPVFQKWIAIYYRDISSAVLNNGYFWVLHFGVGVLQWDPLSLYLFIYLFWM